jgi:hypothetical protein
LGVKQQDEFERMFLRGRHIESAMFLLSAVFADRSSLSPPSTIALPLSCGEHTGRSVKSHQSGINLKIASHQCRSADITDISLHENSSRY